jgi:hypothetical protein
MNEPGKRAEYSRNVVQTRIGSIQAMATMRSGANANSFWQKGFDTNKGVDVPRLSTIQHPVIRTGASVLRWWPGTKRYFSCRADAEGGFMHAFTCFG